MLTFRTDYLIAMAEQAPQTFKRLRKTGALEAHADKKAEEARKLYSTLTDGAERTDSGVIADPQVHKTATEQVYATLIEFPSETEQTEAEALAM